jgi:hypothetical protein
MHLNTLVDRMVENLHVLARASSRQQSPPPLTNNKKKGGLGGVAALCRLKGKH